VSSAEPENEFEFDFKTIVDAANDIVIVTRADLIEPPGPVIVYVNQAFCELTGYSRDEVIGKNPRILQASGTDPTTKTRIKRALRKQQPVRTTIRNYAKSGRAYWLDLSILPLCNASGQATHFVAIERDVTEQMERERTLQTLSTTDSLTGLLNRRAFNELALKEYSRFERQGEKYALLMLDIDHFKAINDRYGHTTGDRVLQSLAENCVANLREHDMVARWGGEEFCVLLPYTEIKTAVAIAEKLRRQIAASELTVGDAVVAATTSIGVAEVLASDINHTEVLERADRALYDAKQTGRDRVCVA